MKDLWDELRFDHTNNWVTFEKKLQPLLYMLNEGKGHIGKLKIIKKLLL